MDGAEEDGWYVTRRAVLAWSAPFGRQTLMMFRSATLLGEAIDRAAITLTLDTDYGAGATETHAWDSTEVNAVTVSGRVQLQAHATKQKTQSMRLTITEDVDAAAVAASSNGWGAVWASVLFEARPLGQSYGRSLAPEARR
jgi:hypothetical protein